MRLTIEEQRFLLRRKEELQREIHDLNHPAYGPCYHDMDERRVELLDELDQVEEELQAARVE